MADVDLFAPLSSLQWVDRDQLKPNDYNPDGKSVQEIGKQLGMRPEEVFRLSDFSRDDFLSMMTKGVHGYSKAELLTKY